MKKSSIEAKWPLKTITLVALSFFVGIGLELMRRHYFPTPNIQEVFTNDLEKAELHWRSVQAHEKLWTQQIFSTCGTQQGNIGCSGYPEGRLGVKRKGKEWKIIRRIS